MYSLIQDHFKTGIYDTRKRKHDYNSHIRSRFCWEHKKWEEEEKKKTKSNKSFFPSSSSFDVDYESLFCVCLCVKCMTRNGSLSIFTCYSWVDGGRGEKQESISLKLTTNSETQMTILSRCVEWILLDICIKNIYSYCCSEGEKSF